jgi:type III restriction enzyme
MLVQVERTGSDQRVGQYIHALDAKDWLMTAGLDEAEIAIKTADTNELNAPENQDLLSRTNRVRVIITKQALQEGWDCPFAYVLCSLAASSNLTGMTQLVGRILRQPQAEKTGVAALDECYVITHHANTASVIQSIKKGLEEDGLGDLVKEIRTPNNGSSTRGPRKVPRRDKFRTTEIYLPLVLWVDSRGARPLDYETDILFQIDWTGLNPAPLVAKIPLNVQAADGQMRRIRLSESGEERIITEIGDSNAEALRFDPTYATRMVSDIIPNPWFAREFIGAVQLGLLSAGFIEQKLGQINGLIVEELRKWLDEQRAIKAEALFKDEVLAGRIQFRLRVDGNNWHMPDKAITFEPEGAPLLYNNSGVAIERSLFWPLYRDDFSSQDERDIAVYLDGEKALKWWHRNVARSQYFVQGWRREKIYPDFIFAVQREDGSARMVVVEMKGDYLDNKETEYKRSVLNLLRQNFCWDQTIPVGTLNLVHSDRDTVECDLVLMSDWRTRLPQYTST